MIDKKNKIQSEERAVLVGLIQKDQTEPQVQEYLCLLYTSRCV